MEDEIGYLIRRSSTDEEEVRYTIYKTDYYIGSSKTCHMRMKIEENDASKNLCVIKSTNKMAYVYNLNSEYSIYLNGAILSKEGRVIRNGDEIRICDKIFRWEYAAKENCSRSLPLDDLQIPQSPGKRYSMPETLEDHEVKQTESVVTNEVIPSTPKNLVKKPYISTSCKINRSSIGCENETERLTQTCVKSRRSRAVTSKNYKIKKISNFSDDKIFEKANIVGTPSMKGSNVASQKSAISSPFALSNTFTTESHKQEENESELFEEEMILNHSNKTQPFHSTPKPADTKPIDTTKSSFSSSVNLNFEVSQDDFSQLKTTDCGVQQNASETIEQHLNSENENLDIDSFTSATHLSKTTPLNSTTKLSFSKENLRLRNSVLKKALNESCEASSSTSVVTNTKIEDVEKSFDVSVPTKKPSECLNESRRNTRGRTSLLRKTLEEETHEVSKERSLTTPEKSTEASFRKSSTFNTESVAGNSANTKLQSSNAESSKSGFVSVSDENDTCENSFIDKYKICNVVKNPSNSTPATVAKCARNLSYFSPPENNRSLEYMESIASTPMKVLSPSTREVDDSYNVSFSSLASPSKESSMMEESILSPLSSARKRRSTGFIPFVGTPSNVYRVTRKISTPFNKSYLSRTSTDFDTLSERRPGKWSTERRSTPFKTSTRKSSIRDSMPHHPTIKESVSFEEIEATAQDNQNEHMNDSKFKFVTVRRQRRRGENSFAVENRILEESELKSDDDDTDCVTEEEEEGNVTFEDINSETPMSMRIVVNDTSTFAEDTEDISNIDKTKIIESNRNAAELKSILTPLPKSLSSAVKKSAKKVTFELPDSPKLTNSDVDDEESFAMISSNRATNLSHEEKVESDTTFDEDLFTPDKTETDVSYDATSCTENSEGGVSAVVELESEKHQESSNDQNASTDSTYSNEVDVSGVERIKSPIRSPVCDQADETATKITSPDAPSYLWKGQVNIPNVAKFEAVLTKISGDCEELRPHLPANVECVGRISSNIVWQYLSEVKKNQNQTISVLRFQLLEDEHSENYTTSYNYLSTKNRMTVVSSLGDGIKDFYMMALPSHTPLPKILLDANAPENEISESHCLLGIVVRNQGTEDIVSRPSTSLPSEKSIDSSTESSASSEQGNVTSNRCAQAFANAIQIPSIIVSSDFSEPLTHTDAMDESAGYSSDVFLSGVKSLLTTPASKTIKNQRCSPTNDDTISNGREFSPGVYLSGVKSLMKTPEISETSTSNGGKRALNFKTDSPKTTIINVIRAARRSARKSAPNEARFANKPLRTCKSLSLNEMAKTNVPVNEETSNSAESTPQDQLANLNDHEAEKSVNDIPTVTTAEPEPAIIDEPRETPSDQHLESENHTERHVESVNCEEKTRENSSNSLLSDHELSNSTLSGEPLEALDGGETEGQFETSDHEETLSSEDDVFDRDRPVSPVISPRCRRNTSKASLSMNLAANVDLSASVRANEYQTNRCESQESSAKTPNTSTVVSPSCSEESKELEGDEVLSEDEIDVSKSSLEVVTSDRSNSRLSDLLCADEANANEDDKGNENVPNEPVRMDNFDSEFRQPTPAKSNASNMLNDSESELESTQNSQDMYMKLDVSSDLMNDLDDQLGSAYCSSNEQTKPNSPAVVSKSDDIFKVPAPISFRLSLIDASNLKRGSASVRDDDSDGENGHHSETSNADTSDDRCENDEQNADDVSPDVCPSIMEKSCYTPFQKFKNSIANESNVSTPSPLKRCRASLRLHRVSAANSPCQNPNTSTHDCSLLSNISSPSNTSAAEVVAEPKQPEKLYEDVVVELNTKLIGVKEKLEKHPDYVEAIGMPVDGEEIAKNQLLNDSMVTENNSHIVDPENDADTESVRKSPAIDNVEFSQTEVASSNQSLIQSATSFENVASFEEVETTALPVHNDVVQEPAAASNNETCTIPSETTQETSPVTTIDESNSVKDESLELPVQVTMATKRSLRVRKNTSSLRSEKDAGNKAKTVTRNRRKADGETAKLETSLKINSKKALEKHNEIHDDKENVCSLVRGVGESRSKRVKLSAQTDTTIESSLAGKKKTKQLRNVENTVVETKPTILRQKRTTKKSPVAGAQANRKRSRTPEYNECKKPCSILLPILDPEIISSPVRVDEAGNITVIKEPDVVATKLRSARLTKKPITGVEKTTAEPGQSAGNTVTKSRQKKTVTFEKRSPLPTRSRKPVVKNTAADDATTESVDRVPVKRSKRGQVEHIEVEEPAKQSRAKRAAKDSWESIEDVVAVEPPKKTRGRTKTVPVELEPRQLAESANLGRPKRGVKSIVVEPLAGPAPRADHTAVKTTRRTKAVKESSARNEILELSPKDVKIAESVRVVVSNVLLEEGPRRMTRRRVLNVAETIAEPNKVETEKSNVAVKPKTTSTRTTRAKKIEAVDSTENVEPPVITAKRGRKPVAAKRSLSNENKSNVTAPSKDATAKPTSSKVEKNSKAKQRVVTSNKRTSLTRKGRVSLTLKTSGNTVFAQTRTAKTSKKVSTIASAQESVLTSQRASSNSRVTRSRAK